MNCQRCRTPLKLDSSLEDLNPAAFDLLVSSAESSLPDTSSSSRLAYPQERKDLYDQVSSTGPSPIIKRTFPSRQDEVPELQVGENGTRARPDMSFIEITQSQVVPPRQQRADKRPSPTEPKFTGEQADLDGAKINDDETMAHEFEKSERLFSVLSAHSDIDHPICTECTAAVLSGMRARLYASTKERDAYAGFLKSLQSSSSPIPTDEDVEEAENALEDMLMKEKAAFEELKSVEAEKREVENEIAELESQSQALDAEEQQFWAERNAFDDELDKLSTTLTSLEQKHAHDQQQLQSLQKTNVYNDTFCIGHDGYFGTINGLRLGRLSGQNVEWSEINAAWGQTALLLATVAERLGYSFQGYRLRPIGSTSRIDKIERPQPSKDGTDRASGAGATAARVTSLDLFSSGDIPLGRVFLHRRFDAGMVAFLDCLSQLGAFVERMPMSRPDADSAGSGGSPASAARTAPARVSRVLPYPINGDKIGEGSSAVSIKLGAGFQQDESWTKACKYVLTCCKFLLAHVSNMNSASRNRE